jgi:RNA polymerase sigma-70 factor, ECF subfamily
MLMIYLAMLEDEQDKKKMTELYEEFRYDCLHVALKITNNMAMAEDAVHDAFLAVIKHKEEMFALTRMDFRKKIVIIVKNKCIDLMRKNKYSSYTHIGDIEYELDSNDLPLDIQIIKKEEFQRISKYISEIDEISRLVLQMKYVQGLSYKEIGVALDMTPKHVDTRIMRAKQKVRKLMEQEGIGQ